MTRGREAYGACPYVPTTRSDSQPEDDGCALAVLGLRLLVQAIILHKSMKKLNESDLWPMFIFFDIWMFFYYIFSVPSLWQRPKQNWD